MKCVDLSSCTEAIKENIVQIVMGMILLLCLWLGCISVLSYFIGKILKLICLHFLKFLLLLITKTICLSYQFHSYFVHFLSLPCSHLQYCGQNCHLCLHCKAPYCHLLLHWQNYWSAIAVLIFLKIEGSTNDKLAQ